MDIFGETHPSTKAVAGQPLYRIGPMSSLYANAIVDYSITKRGRERERERERKKEGEREKEIPSTYNAITRSLHPSTTHTCNQKTTKLENKIGFFLSVSVQFGHNFIIHTQRGEHQ